MRIALRAMAPSFIPNVQAIGRGPGICVVPQGSDRMIILLVVVVPDELTLVERGQGLREGRQTVERASVRNLQFLPTNGQDA